MKQPTFSEADAAMILLDGAQLLKHEAIEPLVHKLQEALRLNEAHPAQTASALIVLAGTFAMVATKDGARANVINNLCSALMLLAERYEEHQANGVALAVPATATVH